MGTTSIRSIKNELHGSLYSAVIILLLIILITLVLAAAVSHRVRRSEGYAFILIGPVPLILKGRAAVALIAALAAVFLLLLVMVL